MQGGKCMPANNRNDNLSKIYDQLTEEVKGFNRIISKKEFLTKASSGLASIKIILDAASKLIPGLDIDKALQIIESGWDAIEDTDIGEAIEDGIEDLITKFIGILGEFYADSKGGKEIQDASKAFAQPFKSPEQLRELHLKQLTTTWEAIRNGELSYLLNGSPNPNGAGTGAYSGQYAGTNQEIVWQFLTGAGFSKESTAGMMGNIEWESGFKTDKIEAGSGIGFGLIQWSHDRRELIEKKASKDNKDIHDIHFQLEYLLQELESGSYWNFPSSVYSFSFDMSYSEFKRTSDIDKATEAFCWCFEKPAEKTAKIDKRKEAAHKYYNEFKDAVFSASGATGSALAQAIMRECDDYEGLNYTQNTNPAAGPTRNGPTHYDCSSLVQKIYRDVVGIDLGTSTHSQIKYTAGKRIEVGQHQPGDLFFYFDSSGNSIHVSISHGGEKIFHAANESLGILYDKIHSGFMPSYAFRINELMEPDKPAPSRSNGGSTSSAPKRDVKIEYGIERIQ